MKQLLTETAPVTFTILDEAAVPEEKRDGRMRIEGRFQQADVKNDNHRRYRTEILGRELKKLNERVATGVPSAADHPTDGKSRFCNVAAKLEEVRLGEDGWVSGRMMLLNTTAGKDAQEVIRSGIQVHVSARGFGTLRPGKMPNGEDVQDVSEDYDLVTYDLVLSDPGFRGADVTAFTEEKETMKTIEELKAAYPDLVAAIEKAAGEQAVTESKEALTKEITEQLKKDQPDVDKLVEQRVAAEKDAIKAAVLEQLKSEGIEEAKALLAQIAELMGPYMGIEKKPTDGQPDPKDAQLEALNQENAQLVEEKTALEAKLAELQAVAEKAVAARKLEEHKADVVKGKEHADKLAEILAPCHSIEEVDTQLPKAVALLESLKVTPNPKDGQRKGTAVVDPDAEPTMGETKKLELTEEQKLQRRAAGLSD